MKTVTLIGDSIRMGYQNTVRAALADVAQLQSSEANGGDSNNVRAHLDEWLLAQPPALLHLNCGLHDIKKAFESDAFQVPPTDYEANLRDIFSRVRAAGIPIIWATTTPVNEQWHHARKGFDRFEADVDAYNQIALALTKEFDIPVNDLFAVVTAAGRDKILRPDGVHYEPEGSALLGKAVADAIRPLLADA